VGSISITRSTFPVGPEQYQRGFTARTAQTLSRSIFSAVLPSSKRPVWTH